MKPLSPALKAIYYTGPLFLLMLVMFLMSTDAGSAQHTATAIVRIVELFPWLADRFTASEIYRIDYNVRKCAHVVEYTLFSILAFRAVAFGNPGFRHRYVLIPLFLGLGFAISDEYHQSFYPSRDGTASDLVFDSFGLTIGLLLCLWRQLARVKTRRTVAVLPERTAVR